MQLMNRKMAAAQALEGEFSEDGLAAMAGEDNLQMALAKSLANRIDDSDMQRSWSKVKSGPRKTAKQPGTALTALTEGQVKPSPLDDLPTELQLAGEALIASQHRPITPEAVVEFPKVRREIAALEVVHGFEPEHEPVVDQTILEFPNTFDEDVDSAMPELTEEILAKMFANMMEHGMAI